MHVAVLGLAAALIGAPPSDDEARWERLRTAFLARVRAGDLDGAYPLLERIGAFDTLKAARLRVTVCLPHDDAIIHREAFEQLAASRDPEAVAYLAGELARNDTWEVRAALALALASHPGEPAESALAKALEDRKWQVRAAAIRALGARRTERSVARLVEALRGARGRLRKDIQLALRRLTGKRFDADFAAWSGWWERVRDTYRLPTKREVAEALGGKVDVRTAVREGFYERIYSERVIFLVDVSASMRTSAAAGRSRMELAKSELRRVLADQMSDKTLFNVIAFSGDVRPWKPRMVRATKRERARAAAFVDAWRPGGETNLWGALQAAFADPNCDTIYVIADGYPTVGEETIPEVIAMKIRNRNRRRGIAIHTIAFLAGKHVIEDKEAARDLMRQLAEDSGGFFKEID